jgi:GNAT superfamily N-acetyltransferase
MGLTIARAKPSHAQELTEIAYAAKAHWNYPEPWLKFWRERGDLMVSATSIDKYPTFAAFYDDECVGFYSLILQEDKAILNDLFIRPAYIGQGVGKQLFQHALGTARALKVKWLELESDPNAKAFYEHMGMMHIGEKKNDLLGTERALPVMRLEL